VNESNSEDTPCSSSLLLINGSETNYTYDATSTATATVDNCYIKYVTLNWAPYVSLSKRLLLK